MVYFGKKLSFSKKITVFLLFSSLFISNTRKFRLLHSRAANGLRLYKTLTIIYNTKTFSQKKRNKYSYKAHFKQNIGGLS